MGKINAIEYNGKTFHVNLNSYAVMQAYKKYGTAGLAALEVQTNEQGEIISVPDPDKVFEFTLDMLRFGLSDNGRKQVTDADVYDLIDAMGGLMSEEFKSKTGEWIREAFNLPADETKKKDGEK